MESQTFDRPGFHSLYGVQPAKVEFFKRRITNKALARYLGRSECWIGLLLNGHRKPSEELARQFSSLLGLPVEDLFTPEALGSPRPRHPGDQTLSAMDATT